METIQKLLSEEKDRQQSASTRTSPEKAAQSRYEQGLWRLQQIHLFHLDQGSLQAHSSWAVGALRVNAKALRDSSSS